MHYSVTIVLLALAVPTYQQTKIKAFFDEYAYEYEANRKDVRMPAKGVPCTITGVLESICVAKEDIKDTIPYCFDNIYDNICVPVYHVSQHISL